MASIAQLITLPNSSAELPAIKNHVTNLKSPNAAHVVPGFANLVKAKIAHAKHVMKDNTSVINDSTNIITNSTNTIADSTNVIKAALKYTPLPINIRTAHLAHAFQTLTRDLSTEYKPKFDNVNVTAHTPLTSPIKADTLQSLARALSAANKG